MSLFDKSNKQSTKIETAVTWSKSNLNMMKIYEEQYHQFLDMTAFDSSMTRAHKTHAPCLSLRYVTRIFTLICMSSSNNVKKLCIPYEE
jgi:hypothetical protein